MKNIDRNEIISHMLLVIKQHGMRDFHYNIVDSAEPVQRCICELPKYDPIIPLADRWLSRRPSKFNRWHPMRGFEKARKDLLRLLGEAIK